MQEFPPTKKYVLMLRPDCTPYLLALGLTKSRTSLVWIAGPLSGLIMQPIVGVIADRSKSRYGRRRPFMIMGSLIVAACLIVLGWTKEIVGIFVGDPEMVKTCSIAVAVLCIYALDFAVNAGEWRKYIFLFSAVPWSKC
jgi:solute carrier family 45, member 1/2/4